RFGAVPAAGDGLEGARLGDQLVDSLLQLLVQHLAIGDDDDAVEDLLPIGGVPGGEAVSQPGDGVGLPGPCRVLHQVGVAGPFSAGGAHQIRDGAPLVVAGEPHLGGGVLLSGDRVGGLLVFEVDELGEDLQPGVSLQDLLPQVGGRYGAVDGRVTAAVVVAPVEG